MTPCPSNNGPPGDDEDRQPTYTERARAAEAAVAQVAATLGTSINVSGRAE